MTKGAETKRTIVTAGLEMANRLGLESVTIGALAKATHMSKSGLFAHFQSKENLQVAILDFAGERFMEAVVLPALKARAGIPRIQALVDNWNAFSDRITGGCIFVSASTEFNERPGKVRDFILHQQHLWVESLRKMARSAVEAGDFKTTTDCEQFAFELYSLLLGFYYYHQLLRDADIQIRQKTAFERLLDAYR